MMMYSTHCLVNVIAGEAGASQRGRRWAARLGGAAWLALVGAVAMTAWDLSMDPVMVRLGAWVWHVPGPYFGIPLRNYLGWLETTFVVFLLYRLFEGRWPARPNLPPAFAYLPRSVCPHLAARRGGQSAKRRPCYGVDCLLRDG